MATAVTIALVHQSPNRLQYLLTTTGAGGPATVLPNANAGSPDLRADAVGADPGSGRNLLAEILATPVANQAAARALLFGDRGAGAIGVSRNPHAHVAIVSRDPAAAAFSEINVDAEEGNAAGSAPSAGFAVLVVNVPNAIAAGITAYLEITAQHSRYQ